MRIKKVFSKIPGIILAFVLALSIVAPAKAAIQSVNYRYNRGYIQYLGNNDGYAVTQGGSAYDEKGIPCHAKLTATIIKGTAKQSGYFSFTGETSSMAVSPAVYRPTASAHSCGP